MLLDPLQGERPVGITALCNALVDVVGEVPDRMLASLELRRGQMHLVDARQQEKISAALGRATTWELGGSSLNALRAANALGVSCGFWGVVGNDRWGERLRRRLGELGIEGYLETEPRDVTGRCVVLVTPDAERTMATHLGASSRVGGFSFPLDRLASSHIFHSCGYQLDTPAQQELLEQALATAARCQVWRSFDLADPFVVERHREKVRILAEKHSDIVFANAEEARLLYGLGPDETASRLLRAGVRLVAIKHGERGSSVTSAAGCLRVPAVATAVVDTTAAGDIYAGGMLAGLVRGASIETAAEVASAAASRVVAVYGAQLDPYWYGVHARSLGGRERSR